MFGSPPRILFLQILSFNTKYYLISFSKDKNCSLSLCKDPFPKEMFYEHKYPLVYLYTQIFSTYKLIVRVYLCNYVLGFSFSIRAFYVRLSLTRYIDGVFPSLTYPFIFKILVSGHFEGGQETWINQIQVLSKEKKNQSKQKIRSPLEQRNNQIRYNNVNLCKKREEGELKKQIPFFART